MSKRFTGICMITKNVSALGGFYGEILGVEVEGDDTHIRLLTEGAQLTVFRESGMEEMAPHSTDGAGYGGYTIEIEVEDVDTEYERLRARGVPIVKPPTTHAWGRRSVWFRDPDGNIVNFYAPAAAR